MYRKENEKKKSQNKSYSYKHQLYKLYYVIE